MHFCLQFVRAVMGRWPNAVLQFEDFQMQHALTLLERYREHHLVFNDDIQVMRGGGQDHDHIHMCHCHKHLAKWRHPLVLGSELTLQGRRGNGTQYKPHKPHQSVLLLTQHAVCYVKLFWRRLQPY